MRKSTDLPRDSSLRIDKARGNTYNLPHPAAPPAQCRRMGSEMPVGSGACYASVSDTSLSRASRTGFLQHRSHRTDWLDGPAQNSRETPAVDFGVRNESANLVSRLRSITVNLFFRQMRSAELSKIVDLWQRSWSEFIPMSVLRVGAAGSSIISTLGRRTVVICHVAVDNEGTLPASYSTISAMVISTTFAYASISRGKALQNDDD